MECLECWKHSSTCPWTLYLEKKWRITRGKEKFFDGYKTTIAPSTEQRGQTGVAQRNYSGNS